jgi:hypothetical protein
MPDWKKMVREKLGTLPLRNTRRDEVVEELAQQLESAYEEALAEGVSEPEALGRSLAQFEDWEKLRREVFESLEGTSLPVWEQKGLFAPRRLAVWMALGLSVLLFTLPAFRQALGIIPVPGRDVWAWTSRAFSAQALARVERSGDKKKYARALAFVALHSRKEDDLRALDAARKAIELDPELTWISAHVSHATYLLPGYDPHPWIDRLKAWDPQNGFPYLLEASSSVYSDWETRWAKYNAFTPAFREALAAEPRWRVPMEKAFAAPRLDTYQAQRFALDRQVLQEQGFDRPDILLLNMWSGPLPDILEINSYADILLEAGQNADNSGRTKDALAAYSSVARFGERLAGAPPQYILGLCSRRLRERAYDRILPMLGSKGHGSESAAVESTLAALRADEGPNRPVPASNAVAERSARIVRVSGLLVAVLGIVTALWIISLIALRAKPDLSGTLNRLASVLSLAPPMLLVSCLLLFVGYYPYARPVGQYVSAQELHEVFGPFLMSVYDFPRLDAFIDVRLSRMFWPAVWSAVLALVGAGLLWRMRNRARPDHPDAA